MENYFKYFVGSLVVMGSFVLLVMLMFHDVPDGTRDEINNNIGVFIGMAVTVIAYEYGSSKSSATKDKTIADNLPDKNPKTPPDETTTK